MAIKYYESPLGWIRIEANKNAIQNLQFVSQNAKNHSNYIIKDFTKKLDKYFATGEGDFSFPAILKKQTFASKVYKKLLQTKLGQVYSYQEIAQKCGSPNAYRAVGNAVNKNQLPIVIPCHRVVGLSKNSGGYSFGLDVKRALLNIEKRQFKFLKIKFKKNISFQKIQNKCLKSPFYEVNINAISYLLHNQIINVRKGETYLYVNFQNLDSELVKKDLIRRFDLDLNTKRIEKEFKNSPFHELMKQFDCEREIYYNNFYQAIITIIIHQFISTKVAAIITNKFLKKFGVQIENHYSFPTYQKIAKIPIKTICQVGLTKSKAFAIQAVSKLILNNQINFKNQNETIKIILEIKGIGKWTVENLKLFAYKVPNAWPENDFGFLEGLRMYLKQKPGKEYIDRLKEQYGKYGTYLTINLWNYFSLNKS